MRKIKSLAWLVMGVLAVGLLTSVTLIDAPETSAAPPPCNGDYNTGPHWAGGSSCWAASQNAIQLALAAAEQRCGAGNVCVKEWTWCPYCHTNTPTGDPYGSDVKLNYGCTGPD